MKRRILMILIAVLSAALLLIIGAVIGMNLQTNTPQTSITPNSENEDEALVDPIDTDTVDTDEETNGTEETDVMLDFASDRYNIQFSYPEEYGDYALTVNELYFFGENVRFPNTNISIGYPKYEGGAGHTTDNVAEGSVTTKQGYTGSYFIFTQGSEFMLFVRIGSPGNNGNLTVVTSTADTQAGAEAELIKVQEILDTLEFDFSNVPLDGCEVSCR